jgi:hypothetical protein
MKNNPCRSNALVLSIAIFTIALLGIPEIASGQQTAFIEQKPSPPAQFYVPMTAQERWKDYVGQNFTQPGAFFQTFFTALGDQTGNKPLGWGGGIDRFPQRLGSEFARFTIGGTVKSTLAAGLQEDTRYHPCVCRGVLARMTHAVSRTFITYDRNGRRTPDIPGLAGIYLGPMAMTMWYPGGYTALGYGVRQGNLALGVTTGITVIREFSPELKGRFRHRQLFQPSDPELTKGGTRPQAN